MCSLCPQGWSWLLLGNSCPQAASSRQLIRTWWPGFLTPRSSQSSPRTAVLFTIPPLLRSLKLPSLLKYGYICKHYLPIVTSFSALLDGVTSICHPAAPARCTARTSLIVTEMQRASGTPVSAAPHLHAVTQVTNP